jgi:CRISPR-associated exonuclease Cas4
MLGLRVSDLKQWVYCPRIVYFTYVLPVDRKTTYAMTVGAETHLQLEQWESRRTLTRYGLDTGERRFRVKLTSERLGLTGILDLLVVAKCGHYPVEFKDSPGGVALNHRYQLAAYGLLVEEAYQVPVRNGFVCLIPQKRVVTVPLTSGVRDRVRTLLTEIRTTIAKELIPLKTRIVARCRECEYRNYCGDWA